MLDEFGTEIDHADSRLDATMKKMAKVLHLSNGKAIFQISHSRDNCLKENDEICSLKMMKNMTCCRSPTMDGNWSPVQCNNGRFIPVLPSLAEV